MGWPLNDLKRRVGLCIKSVQAGNVLESRKLLIVQSVEMPLVVAEALRFDQFSVDWNSVHRVSCVDNEFRPQS